MYIPFHFVYSYLYKHNIISKVGNVGLPYDPKIDLTDALKHHFDPVTVIRKLKECDTWLNSCANITEKQRKTRGWEMAYSLTPWVEYPGTYDRIGV